MTGGTSSSPPRPHKRISRYVHIRWPHMRSLPHVWTFRCMHFNKIYSMLFWQKCYFSVWDFIQQLLRLPVLNNVMRWVKEATFCQIPQDTFLYLYPTCWSWVFWQLFGPGALDSGTLTLIRHHICWEQKSRSKQVFTARNIEKQILHRRTHAEFTENTTEETWKLFPLSPTTEIISLFDNFIHSTPLPVATYCVVT